jgi:hypothetical protein
MSRHPTAEVADQVDLLALDDRAGLRPAGRWAEGLPVLDDAYFGAWAVRRGDLDLQALCLSDPIVELWASFKVGDFHTNILLPRKLNGRPIPRQRGHKVVLQYVNRKRFRHRLLLGSSVIRGKIIVITRLHPASLTGHGIKLI